MEPDNEEPPLCPWCNKTVMVFGELCDLCAESFQEQADWDSFNGEDCE